MQRLIQSLFNTYAGKPILVIGGGPSVLEDLPRIGLKPACVLSANDHALRQGLFKVDYLVNVDKIDCVTHQLMNERMRSHGIPVINPHSWADFRMPDWVFSGNSGLNTVAVAAALGGDPVIVTGLDIWGDGRRYFYEPPLKPVPYRFRKVPPREVGLRTLGKLATWCEGTNIQVRSGPLVGRFRSDHAAPPGCAYRRRAVETVYVQAVRSFHFTHRDIVPTGTIMALSRAEARPRLDKGLVVEVQL